MREGGHGVERTDWKYEDCLQKECGCGVWDGVGIPKWSHCAHPGLRAKG